MATPEPSQTNAELPMIICPTTHNDWDWQETFEGYYKQTSSQYGVYGILESVSALFAGDDPQDKEFRFSYAEVGFLRRYLNENPGKIDAFKETEDRFCLLGGGITSPDNQVSHCEVFIRNYLTGHEYLKSVFLLDKVFPVAWLPDDFGHDPQLPVLIEALGMKAIALSRIPGSIQPTPCTEKQHAASDVRANGLTFYWPGNDGSNMLTHFMPSTYYGITNYSLTDTRTAMNDFLNANGDGVVWPGGIIFATQGGDWQYPNSTVQGTYTSGAYDWAKAIRMPVSGGGLNAVSQLGTFADYYRMLMQSASDIPSFTLYAENYWTGYFASRPQLKIDHYLAAQLLLGAEVLESLLAVRTGTTPQHQRSLSEAISAGWHILVPTTHHDFVTGTSPDSIYDPSGNCAEPQVWDSCGQLAMSGRAVTMAGDALNLAMSQLAESVASSPRGDEIPVVVFNQIGCNLPDTAVVEIEDPLNGTTDFMVRVGENMGPVQRSSDGTLLFQVPNMHSMSYRVVYLVPLHTITPPANTLPQSITGDYLFSNDGLVNLTISQDNGWAITQMTIGNETSSYVQDGTTYANRLGIWDDTGNIYQFGMEFTSAGSHDPIVDCEQGQFSFSYFLSSTTGTLLEAGPIRWRFSGNLTDHSSQDAYTTQYDLIRGETLVRITTTGNVSSYGSSVLASFPMQTLTGKTGSLLEYGTSYFWENRNPQQSWDGLIFRSSHDFAQLITAEKDAVAAVYHNGIPAWTIDGNILRGCLLRNTPGGNRGANGTDTGTHTQQYTLDVRAQAAETGYPLRTALYAQTPLRAAEVASHSSGTMPEAAQLASVAQSDAVLRVAKMNPPTKEEGRNLILRIQQTRTGEQKLDIHLPFLSSGGLIVWPSLVTALETPHENPPEVVLVGTTASFQANRAVWTMKVPITDPNTR